MVQENVLQNPQQEITLNQTTEIVCDNCKRNVFSEGTFIRKVNVILNDQSKDSYLPIPTFYCINCGTVNECFLPDPSTKIQLK